MMAPFVYEQARADAPMHVQIWRPRTASSLSAGPVGRIEGRVVRIFRDRGRVLHWGQRVSFVVPVIDRKASLSPSGVIYHPWDRIGPARFLEAFLEAWKGQIHLVHSQVAPIRRPTVRPICGADQKGFLFPGNV